METIGPDFLHYHNKERIRKNISIRALCFNERMVPIRRHPYLGSNPKLLRETRVAPDDINPTMDYCVMTNKYVKLF